MSSFTTFTLCVEICTSSLVCMESVKNCIAVAATAAQVYRIKNGVENIPPTEDIVIAVCTIQLDVVLPLLYCQFAEL